VLEKLSVRTQLVGMMAGIVVLLAVFAAVVWIAVGAISAAADGMGRGKDVVSDILPPPLYVLEAELTVLQLQGAKASERPPLLAKLATLKLEYDERNDFWARAPLDPAVKKVLLGEQKQAADSFWKLVLNDYVAALQRNDVARIQHISDQVHEIYIAHRNGVDTTVKVASTYANDTMNFMHQTSIRVRWLVLVLAGAGALLAVFFMTLAAREIMHRLGGEPAYAADVTRRIAAGDLNTFIATRPGDESSLLVAMKQMRDSLREAFEKVRANAELEAANQRLLELDKLKSDFLSSVSHELRTPLTSIRGFATLIDREFLRSFVPLAENDDGLQKKSRRIRDNLEIILKESERLTRLINNVLDIAKIEAGRIEWRDAPIHPETLVRDAANAAHGMFESKPAVSLHFEIEAGLPPFIGDADRMQQVMVNLLNNAAKFTERGTVTVKAFLNSDKLIQLDVCDTGIGFPSAEAEAIFDKFQQSKQGNTLADRPAGTGLGLAIAREIVGRHGGRIWATSEPGRGSVFSLTLPLAAGSLVDTTAITSRIVSLAGQETESESNFSSSAGVAEKPTVLVVDDDAGVRAYLTQLLQEQDYEVVGAADGQAAIAAAQSCRPDLITMDLAMPVMDGRTAIVKLRADPSLQHIPIMVISAIQGWDKAGGDLSMSKPLDESRFLENVHLLLGREVGTVSRKVRFLVLHESSEPPAMTPGSFSAKCEADFCPLDELPARIQAGFQGMVVVPTHLIGKVDLSMLQASPLLEVMIMPIQSG